jgi:hypothetical protein
VETCCAHVRVDAILWRRSAAIPSASLTKTRGARRALWSSSSTPLRWTVCAIHRFQLAAYELVPRSAVLEILSTRVALNNAQTSYHLCLHVGREGAWASNTLGLKPGSPETKMQNPRWRAVVDSDRSDTIAAICTAGQVGGLPAKNSGTALIRCAVLEVTRRAQY